MINIAKLLKDAPKGMKLYSPLLGEVEFAEVMDTDYVPIRVMCGIIGERFDKFGRYKGNEYPNAECLLFPSKDCRTWEGWNAPKPHYDITNFKVGLPVLVREYDTCHWQWVQYSHFNGVGLFFAAGKTWRQCIPFNEDTKHLLGTTDMPSEEYINW